MASSAKDLPSEREVGVDLVKVQEDSKLLVADLVNFAKATDGNTLVGAVLDAISTEMATVMRTQRSKSGSAIVKLALETVAPEQFKTAVSVADTLVNFGIMTEQQIESLVEDPTPIVEAAALLFKNREKA